MSEPKTTTINVSNMPVGPLDYLKPHAVNEGHADGYGGAVRFAVVSLAKQLGWKPSEDVGCSDGAEHEPDEKG